VRSIKISAATTTRPAANTLKSNTTGNNNTAIGLRALAQNTNGGGNTANGNSALDANTTGVNNTATGLEALFLNTTGVDNTAVGCQALSSSHGSNNVAVGRSAGKNLTTGSNNIDIGNLGEAGESNTIRIGSAQTRTFIQGVSGAVVTGAAVVVDAAGQLGTAPSSSRFKNEIRPMNISSEATLALKPVTFHYKSDQTHRNSV